MLQFTQIALSVINQSFLSNQQRLMDAGGGGGGGGGVQRTGGERDTARCLGGVGAVLCVARLDQSNRFWTSASCPEQGKGCI